MNILAENASTSWATDCASSATVKYLLENKLSENDIHIYMHFLLLTSHQVNAQAAGLLACTHEEFSHWNLVTSYWQSNILYESIPESCDSSRRRIFLLYP